MTNMFDRVTTLVRANLNDLIDRAEDPEKMIKQYLIDANNQPILGPLTKTVNLTIDSEQTKVCWLRTPSARFAAHVVVDKKFVPHDVLPRFSDIRTLGAETTFSFFSERPRGTQSTCR